VSLQHLAVVMPAYNEAEGLPGFLDEILEHVTPLAERVSLVVVNDRSTDQTASVLQTLEKELPQLVVLNAEKNRGHGPTALAAYRAGLDLGPDAVLHVDGDGQFLGADFPRILRALQLPGVDVIHGVRQKRTDPWYRTALTGCVGALAAFAVGYRIPDVNTPLRAYRPAAIAQLLDAVPENSLVPHVHFSLAERRLGFTVRYVRVESIPRRGSTAAGTMWGEARATPWLPPKRLRDFSVRAIAEVWRVSLSPGRSRP
jgi:dolichol-phosphate mannosyltransferase